MGKLTDIPAPGQTLRVEPSPWHRTLRSALPLAIVLAVCPDLHSQSANNFDTKSIVPEAPQAKSEEAGQPVTKDAGLVSATPSRYVEPEDIDSYVHSVSTVFSIRNRETDPFGQYQDPEAKPVVKTPTRKATRRAQPVQAAPFSDIIRLIDVTTIMPGDKSFLIGSRLVKQGEILPVVHRGKDLRVEVATVSPREVKFRNLENGDTASIKLNLLPLGMTPGNSGVTAPRMMSDKINAPLNLDSGNNHPNR